MEIVATSSLPAVDRPNADRWNAARSRQMCDARITVDSLPEHFSAACPQVNTGIKQPQ